MRQGNWRKTLKFRAIVITIDGPSLRLRRQLLRSISY